MGPGPISEEVGADPAWSRVCSYINLMDSETFSARSPSQWGQPRRPSLDLVFADTLKPLPTTPLPPAPGEERSMGWTQHQARGLQSPPVLHGPSRALHQPSLGPSRSLEILAQQVGCTGC